MSTCEALTTKAELRALEQKLIQELRNKADLNQLQPLKAGIAEATAVGVAASTASELFNRQAQTKIAKASFDAADAGKQAARALNTGTTALSKAGQALGSIGGILSIINTGATAAALAALTKQIARVDRASKERDQKISKNLSDISAIVNENRNTAKQALTTAKIAYEQAIKNNFIAKEAKNLAKGALENSEKIASIISAINDQVNQQIEEVKTGLKNQITSLNQKLKNLSSNLSGLEQARQIGNRLSDFNNLRNEVINLENRTRNLQSNIPNLQNDVRANTQVRTRVLTGVRAIELRQNLVENRITDS